MKNIRNYKAEKYTTNEYTEVEENIYKTIYQSDTLIGLSEEEYELINGLKEWNNKQENEEFYYITYNNRKYYKEKEPMDDEEIIWTNENPEEVYVTSIIFEQEVEYEENAPSSEYISQYPLEDILDKFLCYCIDFYKKENKEDKINSYIEFASNDINDIRNIRTIIGKHVYNIYNENDNTYKLIIE